MAGVAGLNSLNEINGCDAKAASRDPAETAGNPNDCRTFRSADVHRDLLVKRNKVGAETPLGRHLSNLIEQLRNYQKETDPTARANLERFMGWSIAAIQKAA